MQIVRANGEVATLSPETIGERFDGAVVSLGALGVVTQITLAISPTFDVMQTVFENLPLTTLLQSLNEITARAYSVSCFTDWKSDRINQIWFKHRTSEAPLTFADAEPAREPRHPLAGCDPVNCTEQLGVPGPWHERLPHFRMDYTPSAGEELQSEYFLPRDAR